jgi:hypothetical protein
LQIIGDSRRREAAVHHQHDAWRLLCQRGGERAFAQKESGHLTLDRGHGGDMGDETVGGDKVGAVLAHGVVLLTMK